MSANIDRVARARRAGQMTRRDFALLLGAAAVTGPRPLAQAQPRPVIKAHTLNHVAFLASDVRRTVDWYQRTFGLPVQFREDGPAILRLGPGPEFIAVYPANGAKPGFKHMGFGVQGFTRAAIDQALAAHGVKPEWSMRKAPGGEVEELLVRDPDGLVIQVQDVRYAGGGGRLGDAWPQAWTMPPPDARPPLTARAVNHVTFGSASKERAERFYLDLFGLPMLSWDYRPAEPSKILGFAAGGSPRQFIAPGQGRNIGVSHYCLGIVGFNRQRITTALAERGMKYRPTSGSKGCCGTDIAYSPEETVFGLTDPDGFSVQLTDVDYCAGTGPLGTVCIPGNR